MMARLALSGLRHRSGAFVATFLSAMLGATLLMTFASLIDTAVAPGTDDLSAESLTTTASVAGGWCLLIVVFAVASTMTLAVRQRDREIDTLRRAGATGGQLRRMILGEAVAVSLLGAVPAIPAGWLLGGVLLDLLRDTGQVAAGVGHRFGPVALGVGFGVTLLGAVLGALLTSRRIGRARSVTPGWGRMVAAGFLLVAGVSCGVVTATVMKGKGMDAMQTAGQAAIWFSAGLALLAPWLLRAVTAVLAGPLRLVAGAAGEMAATTVRQQSGQMARAVMPVILFTGITTATVYMQAIDDEAQAGLVRADYETSIQILNYVVVGMVALFVAIMLVNTLLAATMYRRAEFARQRLAGATPAQVITQVAAESLLLTVTGVGFGTLASLVTILPFGIARLDDPLPSLTPGLYAGVVAIAVVLTFAAALGAARRAIAGPAIGAHVT